MNLGMNRVWSDPNAYWQGPETAHIDRHGGVDTYALPAGDPIAFWLDLVARCQVHSCARSLRIDEATAVTNQAFFINGEHPSVDPGRWATVAIGQYLRCVESDRGLG